MSVNPGGVRPEPHATPVRPSVKQLAGGTGPSDPTATVFSALHAEHLGRTKCTVDCDHVIALRNVAATVTEALAGWRPPAQRIETIEELDELVFPAIVREIPDDPTEFYPQIWEMGFQTGWCRVGSRFFDLDDCTPRLPVLVLHAPENGDSE